MRIINRTCNLLQVGLQGESQKLYTVNGSYAVGWDQKSAFSGQNFLTWMKVRFPQTQTLAINWSILAKWWDGNWKKLTEIIMVQTKFDAPAGNGSLALDLSSMGKGQVWVNGISIGRYWSSFTAQRDGCDDICDYRGSYFQTKCLTKCSQPSQRW